MGQSTWGIQTRPFTCQFKMIKLLIFTLLCYFVTAKHLLVETKDKGDAGRDYKKGDNGIKLHHGDYAGNDYGVKVIYSDYSDNDYGNDYSVVTPRPLLLSDE